MSARADRVGLDVVARARGRSLRLGVKYTSAWLVESDGHAFAIEGW
jgi:hypothetical protein